VTPSQIPSRIPLRSPSPSARSGAAAGGAADPVPLDTPIELPETADTEAVGERLAAGLRAGDLVVLAGPLGAGKTALVRGLARGLRVAGPVTSPTFVIAREHLPLPDGAGVPLVHVDASRLGLVTGPGGGRTPDIAAELDDLDLDSDLTRAVVAVEWGEGVAERLAAGHLLVRLDRRPDDIRVAVVHRVAPGPESTPTLPVNPSPSRAGDPEPRPTPGRAPDGGSVATTTGPR
jgi:tRNA threonylcarbamoyladenosine biosynthesis protein TsaE